MRAKIVGVAGAAAAAVVWMATGVDAQPRAAADSTLDGGISVDPFEEFLRTEGPVASGFELPRGDDASAVKAMADGRVLEAGTQLVIEHLFYENAQQRRARAVYSEVTDLRAAEGQEFSQGQILGGAGAATTVEVVLDDVRVSPEEFVAGRAELPVPSREPHLVLVHHGSRRLRYYRSGQLVKEYGIAIGQADGAKEKRGDLRTPVGMYFVTVRSQGPFTGDYADFFGGHWIKVNYPNPFDAARGVDAGWVSAEQFEEIASKWKARELTTQKTRLGGGIGLHGWIDDWEADAGTNLSWGCLVMHNDDIEALYPQLPVGTMVVFLE